MNGEELYREYERIATRYLDDGDEECRYDASMLSRKFIEAELGPEEVIQRHFRVLEEIFERTSPAEHAAISRKLSVLLLEAIMVYTHTHRRIEGLLNDVKANYIELEKAKHELEVKTSQLIQTEKMTALGELSAAVAHEINQPLNAIRIICDDVKRDVERERVDQDYLKESVCDVVSEVRKMTEIVDHMRIFTRRTEGSINEKIRIGAPVEGVFKLLGQQLKIRGIDVTREIEEDLYIIGDPVRLEQVVMNLVTNARDAICSNPIEKGRRIAVRAYSRTEREGGERSAVLEIEDNGPGVPLHLREKIFEPFFTGKDPGEGTGLGLSVSREIVETHSGKIEVLSGEGEGTTFRITLPALVQSVV